MVKNERWYMVNWNCFVLADLHFADSVCSYVLEGNLLNSEPV